MRHVLINLATKKAEVYTSKKDIADKLNVSSVTIWKWSKGKFKSYKGYQIYFNVDVIKSQSKIRNIWK